MDLFDMFLEEKPIKISGIEYLIKSYYSDILGHVDGFFLQPVDLNKTDPTIYDNKSFYFKKFDVMGDLEKFVKKSEE